MAKRIKRFFLMFATALVLAFCGIFAACGDGEGLGGLGGLGGGQEQQHRKRLLYRSEPSSAYLTRKRRGSIQI